MRRQALLQAYLNSQAITTMSLAHQNGPASGGYYGGSLLPSDLPWNTYNYCNAPHVNAPHYSIPEPARHGRAELVYVLNVQRHAKRTPDNLAPGNRENMFNPAGGWDCSGFDIYDYIAGGSRISTRSTVSSWNPFLLNIWNGTCANGQLTPAGFRDAVQHGRDFWSVYGPGGAANILDKVTPETVKFRASPSARTAQVSSGLLKGMDHGLHTSFEVETQPEAIDGIVPSYTCSYADDLRTKIEQEDVWKKHLKSKQSLFDEVNAVLGTGAESDWNSWIDHAFDFLSSRTCHGHPLPTNSTNGKTLSSHLAKEVFQEGDWEYNYIWNESPQADEYVKYSIAVLVKELVLAFKSVLHGKQGEEKMRFIVGHDGTMVRLLKTLAQSGAIRWPALGSEVVFEVWKSRGEHGKHRHFVRILSYGETLHTRAQDLTGPHNTPGPISWIPLSKLVSYLEKRIPTDLVEKCSG